MQHSASPTGVVLSSFIVTGRGSLPSDPRDMLPALDLPTTYRELEPAGAGR
jgi:hypothetical protein